MFKGDTNQSMSNQVKLRSIKVAQIEEISEKCTSLGKVVFTGSL